MATNRPQKPAANPKRYPSRENTKYVGISLGLYGLLQQYAEEHSTPDEVKTLTWAAKRLLRIGLAAEGHGDDPRKEQ